MCRINRCLLRLGDVCSRTNFIVSGPPIFRLKIFFWHTGLQLRFLLLQQFFDLHLIHLFCRQRRSSLTTLPFCLSPSFCGLWPAIFAVAISGITALYFFVTPRGTFEASPHGIIALVAFLTISLLIIAVVTSLHAAIRKIAAQEQETKLPAKELQHRTGNLLTVIQSIAHQSLTGDLSLAQGREIFEGRLQALARTQRQLTSS